MNKKTILITGATSGIGRITAEKLAQRGDTVLIHGRSQEKIDATVKEIKESTSNQSVFGYQADLNKLSDVKRLSEQVLSDYLELDVLINNAGLGPGTDETQTKTLMSEDGYELIFQINYLATVLLSQRLLPALKKAQGRIVNVASAAQAPLELETIMQAQGMSAYAQSKLAVITFSMFFAEYIRDDLVTVNALDPGSLLNTRMVKDAFGESERSPEIGANAQVLLATSSDLKSVTGEYFCEGKKAQPNELAYDLEIQKKLWEKTQGWLGSFL